MYPNDLWIADPNGGSSSASDTDRTSKLYKIEDDQVTVTTNAYLQTTAVHVSQDMMHVYLTNLQGNLVSRYRNGVHVSDIKVGSLPMGICENSNGVLYVTNYGDNTVSKIVDGVVTRTIPVHAGPRGIIANSRNKVYVACYLGNTIDVIENDVLVESIEIKYAPRAITCDTYDNIWVANYGSNTIAKINNSKIILTFDLANISRGPCAIVTDSSGTVYVANYLGNDVTVISGSQIVGTIPVSAAPTAIGVTRDDTIYVTSEIEGTLTKIVKNAKVDEFAVCSNPIGFGDFTGCATYNIYHDTSSSDVYVPMGGWAINQMNAQIQNLLGQVQSKTVQTSADLVSYDSLSFPTVKDALDKLLLSEPVINKFSLTKDMYEYGQTVTSVQVNWSFNKPMKTGVIKVGATTIADLAQSIGDPVEASGSSIITLPSSAIISNPSVLVLEVEDDAGNKATATANIKFEHRFLYGTVSYPLPIISQTTLETLTKSPVMENPFGKYFEIDCGLLNDRVPVIAVPVTWNIDTKQLTFINGYTNNWIKTTVSYTNASGGNIAYNVFTFDFPLAGELIASIVDFI